MVRIDNANATDAMFCWSKQKKSIIGLSPMADMTDGPFCSVVRAVNNPLIQSNLPHPDLLPFPVIFREMVASEAIVRGNAKTLKMARFDPIERPLIQQIFGADPETMARAAAIIMEKFSPDGIDVNMGCPVYKLTHHFNGAALMKEPERATSIVRAIKAAIGHAAPVSVKIRLGWSDPTQGREFAKVLEDAGADLITVHGRTKCQAYGGKSDWVEIGEIKKQVLIPVLANGDIVDGASARQALSLSRCDGVMIARGALGNPWVFGEIEKVLVRHCEGRSTSARGNPETIMDCFAAARNDVELGLPQKISVILRHAELMVKHYGPHGIILFRKHLSWYSKKFSLPTGGSQSEWGPQRIVNIKSLRMQLMTVQTFDELKTILAEDNILKFSSL